MTDKRDLKRRVRERMERTGESYMTALRHVIAQREPDEPVSDPPADEPPLPFVELRDLTDIARDFAITCRVVMYPSLSDIDPREALAAMCLLLGKTREDRAFDLFRDVLLAGERPRINLEHRVEEAILFANRVRAGIGGISNGGHMLAMHLDSASGSRIALFLLQLTPNFVATLREPTLVLAAPDDVVGIATLNEGTTVIKLPGGGTNP